MEPVPAGTRTLPVVSDPYFSIGELIVIDAGTPIEEFNKIVGFGSLILESPLKYDHGRYDRAGATGLVLRAAATGAVTGLTASLDAAGFKSATSLCCPSEMEQFFNRLLDKMGLDVCSKPHVQGLMHWFTCVPDMDFQYMIDVINNGNPCKYWEPKGTVCPVLSDRCAGRWCR